MDSAPQQQPPAWQPPPGPGGPPQGLPPQPPQPWPGQQPPSYYGQPNPLAGFPSPPKRSGIKPWMWIVGVLVLLVGTQVGIQDQFG